MTTSREEAVARIIELLDTGREHEERYYTQDDSPLGRTRHLRLSRRGEIRSFKIGRTVYMLRDEVHEYIEAHQVLAAPKTEAPAPKTAPKHVNPLQLIKGI